MMSHVLDYLNNGSVSAFLGAFFAYFLVQFTDRRRLRRNHDQLKNLMAIARRQAGSLLENVESNKDYLSNEKSINTAPYMPFLANEINEIKLGVLDCLSADEKLATDAICYLMNGIDGILTDSTNTADEIRSMDSTPLNLEIWDPLVARYRNHMADAISNLRRLQDVLDWYIKGDFNQILTSEYHESEYQ